MAALDQADDFVHHLRGVCHVGVVAVEREDVATQKDVTAEALLQLAQDGVLRAGELRRNRVVESELASRHQTFRTRAARGPRR